MPYIRRKTNGEYMILSWYKGKNHTHQLSGNAAAQLRLARGEIEGLEISVGELMDLRRAGDAYRVGDRPKQQRRQPAPAPKPREPKPVRVEAITAPPVPAVDSIICPSCRLPTSSSAAFCSRCGVPLAPTNKPRTWVRWLVLWITIITALLAYQAAKNWLP